MKCPSCGANIEVTKLSDGSTLIRKDCQCCVYYDEELGCIDWRCDKTEKEMQKELQR